MITCALLNPHTFSVTLFNSIDIYQHTYSHFRQLLTYHQSQIDGTHSEGNGRLKREIKTTVRCGKRASLSWLKCMKRQRNCHIRAQTNNGLTNCNHLNDGTAEPTMTSTAKSLATLHFYSREVLVTAFPLNFELWTNLRFFVLHFSNQPSSLSLSHSAYYHQILTCLCEALLPFSKLALWSERAYTHSKAVAGSSCWAHFSTDYVYSAASFVEPSAKYQLATSDQPCVSLKTLFHFYLPKHFKTSLLPVEGHQYHF